MSESSSSDQDVDGDASGSPSPTDRLVDPTLSSASGNSCRDVVLFLAHVLDVPDHSFVSMLCQCMCYASLADHLWKLVVPVYACGPNDMQLIVELLRELLPHGVLVIHEAFSPGAIRFRAGHVPERVALDRAPLPAIALSNEHALRGNTSRQHLPTWPPRRSQGSAARSTHLPLHVFGGSASARDASSARLLHLDDASLCTVFGYCLDRSSMPSLAASCRRASAGFARTFTWEGAALRFEPCSCQSLCVSLTGRCLAQVSQIRFPPWLARPGHVRCEAAHRDLSVHILHHLGSIVWISRTPVDPMVSLAIKLATVTQYTQLNIGLSATLDPLDIASTAAFGSGDAALWHWEFG
jgi:hypothetical protein